MSNLMATLMLIFISCILISLFYWHVVRPVFILAIRYRLFARRDELRSLAVEGDECASSFSYTYLEAFINKTIGVMPTVCLASFLFYSLRFNPKPSADFIRFNDESSKTLMEIRNKSVQDALMMMTINSPIMVIVAALIGALLWLSGKINKMMVFNSTENFVGEVSPA